MKKFISSIFILMLVISFALPVVNAEKSTEVREIKANFVTTTGVAMRDVADKTGKTLVVIPKNTHIFAKARSGDWYKVSYKNHTGWILKDYVAKESAVTNNNANKNGSTNKGNTANTGNVNSGTYVDPNAPKYFQNCTELRVYYPSGVKKGHPAYAGKHDRDKDGWACEINK
ncbi:excalibur calcium-binding domain-containing protein [Solibacillus sp. CAU 1738]|uniref:excalibur calcium-binding domain-containing protein n=1 Tax=Solibacillus sp. CAU 1738 TaxID=3140363 RepID=UPI0032618AA4